MHHPSFSEGNVAVIMGAADGIGLAAAQKFSSLGLRVCMVDSNGEQLQTAASALDASLAVVADVSDRVQVESLRDQVLEAWGRVDVLMNNAGIGRPTSSWGEYDNWQSVLEVNLWGVINGVQAFTQTMIDQQSPALVINTGSKQGITNPPGNPAYNVSKAAVKSLTESLQHSLRETPDCQVSAHLLVPGFTYTGMIRKWIAEKPEAAWTPEQVVDFLLDTVARGDFYVLCPDNDVDRETDNKRMDWAAGDLIENRPALSRWDPEYADAFETFMDSGKD